MEKLGCPDNLLGQWMAFYGYLVWFHICCELALETWAKGSSINSLGVHDLTYSLPSLQWSGLFDQQTLFLTENCLYSVRNEAPKRSRGSSGFMMFVVKIGNGCFSQCWHKPRPIFSQPKQLPWLYHTCCGHAYDMHMIIITTLKRLQTLAYTSSPVFSL